MNDGCGRRRAGTAQRAVAALDRAADGGVPLLGAARTSSCQSPVGSTSGEGVRPRRSHPVGRRRRRRSACRCRSPRAAEVLDHEVECEPVAPRRHRRADAGDHLGAGTGLEPGERRAQAVPVDRVAELVEPVVGEEDVAQGSAPAFSSSRSPGRARPPAGARARTRASGPRAARPDRVHGDSLHQASLEMAIPVYNGIVAKVMISIPDDVLTRLDAEAKRRGSHTGAGSCVSWSSASCSRTMMPGARTILAILARCREPTAVAMLRSSALCGIPVDLSSLLDATVWVASTDAWVTLITRRRLPLVQRGG